MASYQDLTASNIKDKSEDAGSTKATMKADMDAALAKNQHDVDSDYVSEGKAKEYIAKTVNDAGETLLDEAQLSRIIEMAWEDRTPFGAIEHSYGLDETDVIKLMRQALKPSSFRLWRQRVSNRATKHEAKRSFEVGRAYCKTQYKQR